MLLQLPFRTSKIVDTTHLAPVVVVLYLLGLWLGATPLLAVTGMILWGMLPGHYILQFLRTPRISLAGQLILGSVLSFSVTVLSLVLFRAQVPFTDKSQIGFVLILNMAVYGAYLVYKRSYPAKIQDVTKEELTIFFLSLIPFAMFIVRSLLNPYLVDQDGASYLRVMEEIRRTHTDTSFLGARRAAFTNAVMSLNYLLHVEFLPILKFVLPGYVWFILGLPFALFTSVKKQGWFAMAGLLLLSSAAMASGVDRVKPEILIFMLWFSVVLFFLWTVTTKRLSYYVVGLVLAYLSFRSHDTGAITLLSYLVGGLLVAGSRFKEMRSQLTGRTLLLAAVIILPYLQILHVTTVINSVKETFVSLPQAGGFHFKLWFLNDYQSGGVLAGWPGWMFVLFYLFNGFTAVFFLIGALRRVYRQKNGQTWLALSLPIMSMLVYLAICEIMPRFGYFFLPDRAWVHFFYDACLIFLLAGYLANPEGLRLPSWLRWLGWSSIAGGAVIGLLLTVSLGSVVSRSEQKGIQRINQLPANAIILSTQPFNSILTEVYGQREFISVELPDKNASDTPTDIASLRSYLNAGIDDKSIGRQTKDLKTVTQTLTETVTDAKDNGILVSHRTRVLSETVVSTSEDSGETIADSPIYIFYSFSKTDGLQSKLGRASWLSGIDMPHRNLFGSFTSDQKEVAYRDDSVVLVRIR